MAVIGLDVGTTCCKCGVYSNEGKLLKIIGSEYDVVRDKGNQYIDMRALINGVKKILAQGAEGNDIVGICVSSLGESFVPVGNNFEVLCDSMLYTDTRGMEQCEQLKSSMSDEEIYYIAGTKAHSMYSLPKMMWLKQNQSSIYNKSEHLLLMGDFIGYLLTGEAVIDYSLAARTMAFDVVNKTYSKKLLDLAEIDENKLSKPVKSGTVIGTIRKSISDDLKINSRCVVIAGGHDQVCSALGAGVLKPGTSVDGIGTVECITPVFDSARLDYTMGKAGYSCVPYVLDGSYVTYMFNYSGGGLLKWFKDKINPTLETVLREQGKSFYDHYNKIMPQSPTDLLIMPHFAGAATPYMDEGALGAILNMTLATTAEDIYRAIMESTTYEMRLNSEFVAPFGIKLDELTVTGGGSSSDEWLQIKADIMNVPIFPLASTEAGVNGAAMLALTTLKLLPDLESAVKNMVSRRKPFYPSAKNAEFYDNQFKKYTKIYKCLKELR